MEEQMREKEAIIIEIVEGKWCSSCGHRKPILHSVSLPYATSVFYLCQPCTINLAQALQTTP